MNDRDKAQLLFLTLSFVRDRPSATVDDIIDHLLGALDRGELSTHDEAYMRAIVARREPVRASY